MYRFGAEEGHTLLKMWRAHQGQPLGGKLQFGVVRDTAEDGASSFGGDRQRDQMHDLDSPPRVRLNYTDESGRPVALDGQSLENAIASAQSSLKDDSLMSFFVPKRPGGGQYMMRCRFPADGEASENVDQDDDIDAPAPEPVRVRFDTLMYHKYNLSRKDLDSADTKMKAKAKKIGFALTELTCQWSKGIPDAFQNEAQFTWTKVEKDKSKETGDKAILAPFDNVAGQAAGKERKKGEGSNESGEASTSAGALYLRTPIETPMA
mmetsp:Transcript_16050/g.45680  ORF Transcript_16050/g.45680 Transcript_16050/m.45680 type:complete len:264 (+) Transcript_16050:393-1184(+)